MTNTSKIFSKPAPMFIINAKFIYGKPSHSKLKSNRKKQKSIRKKHKSIRRKHK